ncbi:MAG: GNAT family N-acetyltransferase, partial [Candidatus Woesearchaeota archaeon]
ILIYDKENLIGTGYIGPSNYQTTKHYCEISKVMVDPAIQGKGIGKLIMERLEKYAKKAGYTHIILDTWDIPHIVRFYKKCRYKVVGKIPEFVRYKGKYHDVYNLAKKLNAKKRK